MTFIEDEEKTTITMIVLPVSPTEEEIKTFEASVEMVREGFTGTFKQLAEYLKLKAV